MKERKKKLINESVNEDSFSTFDTTAPIWALAYLHETLYFTSGY
jgi:hypothetical protein